MRMPATCGLAPAARQLPAARLPARPQEIHDALASIEAEAERLFTSEKGLMDTDAQERDRLYTRAQQASCMASRPAASLPGVRPPLLCRCGARGAVRATPATCSLRACQGVSRGTGGVVAFIPGAPGVRSRLTVLGACLALTAGVVAAGHAGV
jgi:nuclear pore complex protein Nup62